MALIESDLTHNYVPQVSVTPEQALKAYKSLQDIMKKVLVEGTDYGIIPGTPKPSLYKPGAENLLRFYGLGHTVEKVDSVQDWESGFFYYEYKVAVHKTFADGTKHILSECVGSANSREPKYYKKKNGDLRDPFEQVNTFQKMAIKRALVGATLQATGASGLFTQDIEDMDLDTGQDASKPKQPQNQQRSGQNNTRPLNAKSQVINMMNSLKMSWDGLAEVATAALGRPIKKVMAEIKEDEWQTVLSRLSQQNVYTDGNQTSGNAATSEPTVTGKDLDDLPF